jgi:hypothetical protein
MVARLPVPVPRLDSVAGGAVSGLFTSVTFERWRVNIFEAMLFAFAMLAI